MGDSALAVQKRVIQAMTHLYRVALVWISRAKTVTEDMEAVWTVVGKIKVGGRSLHIVKSQEYKLQHQEGQSLGIMGTVKLGY